MNGQTYYMPDTERRNDASRRIDELDTAGMLRVINDEDKKVAAAVEREIPSIALAVEAAERAIRGGGRVVYIGCGTSGRLGVLDASECPPTYNVPAGWFTGIIAGGAPALVKSSEGLEDRPELGEEDLIAVGFSADDMLVGLAASGRTPYVIGGLRYARGLGAVTACVVCGAGSPMADIADITIAVETGPEVITGSTRMKAGTAQKMVLNMISTGTMIRLGKVYGNLMVDLRPTNDKLVGRARRIIGDITGCDGERADLALAEAGGSLKAAAVMLTRGVGLPAAEALLAKHGGRLKEALADFDP
jgi:N-acetylmuramic acid 6-phosphate etherase